MLYGDWIGRWGRSFPEKESLVDVIEDRRYTYGELSDDVHRMADFLSNHLSIESGDRVAVLAFNRAEYIKLFFALSRLGAILVPLNFRLAPAEFIYYLEDAAPKAIFFDQAHQESVDGFKSKTDLKHYVCFDEEDAVGLALPGVWPALSAEPPPEVEIGPDDPQLIIYTSGTTGLPKGVILTHGMLTWNAINTHLGWDLRSTDRTILHAAMFYTAGWNVFTLPLFYGRGVNILIKSFEADLILDLIERERVTVFFGVPTMFQMLLGLFRLGVLVDFLSHPVVVGFTNGAAIIIATSQLSKLFGVESEGDTPIAEIASVVGNLGEANAISLSFFGVGVFKSTDGGQNWTPIGLEETRYIARILVDPTDSDRVYVAATGKLFGTGPNRGDPAGRRLSNSKLAYTKLTCRPNSLRPVRPPSVMT